MGRSDGRADPVEQRRDRLYLEIVKRGAEALPALSRGLADTDVALRKNVALALLILVDGYGFRPSQRLDIRGCLPALLAALRDPEMQVRGWAAQAIGGIGPDAVSAVPALAGLLGDPDEGARNGAFIALGEIGPGAREALPALRRALEDPSADVRHFARRAIEEIGGPT
jgi:HEAT repeat protein